MKRALIVIDVQNYYINEYTKEIPLKIAEHIKEVDYDSLILTKFINHRNSNAAKAFHWYENTSSPDTDICEELKEYVNKAIIIEKDTYSAFKSKELSDHLEKEGILEIYICGFDTEACVLATAFEAFDLGYNVKPLENLTACSKGNDFKEAGLKILLKRIKYRF